MGAIKEPVMEQKWQKYKQKINNNSITVKILINRILFKLTLINTGYEYYSIVNKDLITKLRLPRIKIPPKPITGFIKENIKEPWVEIIEIVVEIWCLTLYLFRRLGELTLIVPCYFGHSSVNLEYKIAL